MTVRFRSSSIAAPCRNRTSLSWILSLRRGEIVPPALDCSRLRRWFGSVFWRRCGASSLLEVQRPARAFSIKTTFEAPGEAWRLEFRDGRRHASAPSRYAP
jgi:hypothetical protein